MISIFPLSQHNMLGFTLDGEVDAEGIRRLLMAVEAKVITHGRLRLLGNIKNIGGVDSYQTFWDTIKTKKDLWGKIERYAILTDHGWLTPIVEGVDYLASDMKVKTFRLSEGELAHQWLQQDDAPSAPLTSESIREIELSDDRLLGIAIVGKLNRADYDRLNVLIEEKVRHHGHARILLEVINIGGLSAGALWEDLKASVRLYSSIERMAIIGDQSWLKPSVKVSDLLTPGLEMAAFSSTDHGRAIAWLG